MTNLERLPGALLLVAAICAVACGQKQPPASAQGVEQAGPEAGPEELDPEAEARIEKINALINELNAAIESQDADKFWSAFTTETRDLFYKVAQLDMAIAGIKDRSPADHVLKQQKDFNVVYTIENFDPVEMTGILVGVLRDTGDEARFPMAFVEQEDGTILVDYTGVLTERLANLKASRMRTLVAELNKAVDTADADLYRSVLTDATVVGCPAFLHDVPAKGKKPPKLEAILKAMQGASLFVEITEMDAESLSAILSTTTAGEPGKKVDVKFVFEEGIMRLDASAACVPQGKAE